MQVLVTTSTMYMAYTTWAIALFHQEKAFDMAWHLGNSTTQLIQLSPVTYLNNATKVHKKAEKIWWSKAIRFGTLEMTQVSTTYSPLLSILENLNNPAYQSEAKQLATFWLVC